jgi:hypothetical protein
MDKARQTTANDGHIQHAIIVSHGQPYLLV